MACATGELAGVSLEWASEACVAVVLASGGYPGAHATGVPIQGVERAAALAGVEVSAGTALKDGELVTGGGRVLTVSALGQGIKDARRRAYEAASFINFEGKHLRTDVALRAEDCEENH